MTGASVSTTLRIQVLKLLLHDRAPAWVVVALQRTPAEVVEIAEEHGWPNKAAMAELLQGLERQLKRELQPPAATHSPIPGQRVTDPLPTRDPAARADGVLQTVPIGKVIPDPNNPVMMWVTSVSWRRRCLRWGCCSRLCAGRERLVGFRWWRGIVVSRPRSHWGGRRLRLWCVPRCTLTTSWQRC